VFHDSTTYVFTEEQVESVFRPHTVEIGSGYTIYSHSGSAPNAIVLRSGATDSELSEVKERLKQQMAVATDQLAKEYPSENIRGVNYEFHNLIIFCAFTKNCSYERQLLTKVQSLGLYDRSDPNFDYESRP